MFKTYCRLQHHNAYLPFGDVRASRYFPKVRTSRQAGENSQNQQAGSFSPPHPPVSFLKPCLLGRVLMKKKAQMSGRESCGQTCTRAAHLSQQARRDRGQTSTLTVLPDGVAGTIPNDLKSLMTRPLQWPRVSIAPAHASSCHDMKRASSFMATVADTCGHTTVDSVACWLA